MAAVVALDQLPRSGLSYQFEGHLYAPETPVSFYMVDAGPGEGPGPHTHPYQEVLIVLEGEGEFIAGEETLTLGAGQVLIVGANEVHGFKNVGSGRLRQLDIHCRGAMEQHTLPPAPG